MKPPTVTKVTFTTLPPEMHLLIFDLFTNNPAASACLGLTSKYFYGIHWSRHGKVGLSAYQPCALGHANHCGHKKFLYKLLSRWKGVDLSFKWRLDMFLTMARRLELREEEDKRRDWALGLVDVEV
jgi:hypothetical protein